VEKKVFRSRISVLLNVFVISVGLIPMIRAGEIILPVLYVCIGLAVFFAFFCYGMRYEITEKHIVYKMWGAVSFKVPLSGIVSVERSYNPLSAPAASLKRLKISLSKQYKFPYVLASSVREKEFLEMLKTLNPDIYIRVSEKKWWHRIYRIWDWDI